MAPRPSLFERPDLESYHAQREGSPNLSDTAFNRVRRISAEYRSFLSSTLDFRQENDEFEPVRMLGAGTYGQVGLWGQQGADGRTIDEVAVKESLRLDDNEQDPNKWPGLPKEVVIQAQLNESGCEQIVHLRGFKYYPGQFAHSAESWRQANVGKTRMYLEYCPHGNLENLLLRYRAWSQHLPEIFVWHLFHSLAKAMCAMQTGATTNFYTKQEYPGSWGVVHLDLKVANIFLGYERETSAPGRQPLAVKSPYPTIKVSDFGMSEVTGSGDPKNPSDLWWTCTYGFRPLEHAENPRIYGNYWANPPNGKRLNTNPPAAELEAWQQDPGFYFGNAHNIGSLGACMYTVLKLANVQEGEGFLDEAMRLRRSQPRTGPPGTGESEQEYLDRQGHAIEEINVKLNQYEPASPQVYSPELRNLVRECLRPSIALRIQPDQLLEATQRGLAGCEAALRARHGDQALAAKKVFFAKNEINSMPPGASVFPQYDDDWETMMDQNHLDMSWGSLKPPAEKWASQIARYSGTSYGVYRMSEDGREVEFDESGKMVFVKP